ncbi:transporter substrate-binding domain-containing protein [Paenibacillus sanguinis]|uniref:transporter substrate-binding domain-containing protein n=1 Tax=Paenibacillus sanguinis TaxID=225906 RepID=UPI0003710475|nr:transporter substrate-binding domain-containing protein [Paenibacillus sanguinis]
MKAHKKRIISFMAAIAVAVGLTACSSGPSNTGAANSDQELEVLTVGIGNVIPPQFFVNENGELTGYDYEVLQEVDARLPQYEFKYEQLELAATLVALESGKIQIADWQFGKSAERAEKFLYPDEPYDIGVLKLITQSERTELNTLDDMAKKKMAQMPTSSFYTYLKKYNEEHPDQAIDVQTVDSLPVADAMKMVESGRIDGTLALAGTYNKINEEMQLNTRLGGTIDAYPVYHILPKNRTDIKEAFDKVLKEMREDGTLSELSQKWYGLDNFAEYESFTGSQSFGG